MKNWKGVLLFVVLGVLICVLNSCSAAFIAAGAAGAAGFAMGLEDESDAEQHGDVDSSDQEFKLLGIFPEQVQPGEVLTLELSGMTDEKLAALELYFDDIQIEVSSMGRSDSGLIMVAPPVESATITVNAKWNGNSIGKAVFTVLQPTVSHSISEIEYELTTATASLESLLDFTVTAVPQLSVIDQQEYQTARDDFHTMMVDYIDLMAEELSTMDAEQRLVVIAFLENSGYFEIINSIPSLSGVSAAKVGSLTSDIQDRLSRLDTISMVISNYAMLVDAAGIVIAVFTSGSTAHWIVAVKVFLCIIDNVIDGFIPTDISSTSIVSEQTADQGDKLPFVVEGVYYSQKGYLGASINMVVESVIKLLPLPAATGSKLTSEVVKLLTKKLGTRLSKEWLAEPFANAFDPGSTRVGPFTIIIDIREFSNIELSNAIGVAIPGASFINTIVWFIKKFGDYDPTDAIVFSNSENVNMVLSNSSDSVCFDVAGNYNYTLRTYCWGTPVDLILYEVTWLKHNSSTGIYVIDSTQVPVPSPGVDDVVVNTRDITITVWDDGQVEDGDQIDLIVNGEYVLTDFVLSYTPHTESIHLSRDSNDIVIHADNEGSAPPNTAGIEISNVVEGESAQSWSLGLGEDDTFVIFVE